MEDILKEAEKRKGNKLLTIILGEPYSYEDYIHAVESDPEVDLNQTGYGEASLLQ